MSTFGDGLKGWVAKVEIQNRDILSGVADEVYRSVVNGSELTGAPGQPIDTGHLHDSWQLVKSLPLNAVVGTNVDYAPAIEAGIGPHGAMTVRSKVGGFYSAVKTVQNFDRIVEHVTKQVTGK